jgi:DNA-binding NarL/FixJ family response regulator
MLYPAWTSPMKQQITVLIVDDSSLILKRLHAMLEKVDAVGAVLHAKDYEEAVDIIRNNDIQIALLDIHLKDKSGIDLLKYIREEKLLLKVLMLTNQADSEYNQLCMKLGADHFLDKSKDFTQIPAIISSLFV